MVPSTVEGRSTLGQALRILEVKERIGPFRDIFKPGEVTARKQQSSVRHMESALFYIAIAIPGILAIPTILYGVECLAGCLPPRDETSLQPSFRPPVAIIVPAHNEECGVAATVSSIRMQMAPGDRILVVADNCTDHTAAVARAAGAEVVERLDDARRGKGFALDFGLACLAASPRPVVVFIDADCSLLAGSLDALARAVEGTRRPVQSCNLMITPDERRNDFGIAEFAFLVKNLVRPRGMARIGLPCQLTGTGMALPWTLTDQVRVATDDLAEDMRLGLDLAAAGHFPVYCEEAGVRSYFPETAVGAASQRNRWESGHLRLLASGVRRMLKSPALANPRYLAMILDVMVPPLTFLTFLILMSAFIGLLAGVAGIGWMPFALAVGLGVILSGTTMLAWVFHGRLAIPAETLLRIPHYAASKAWIYPRLLAGRSERAWVRTGRDRAGGQ